MSGDIRTGVASIFRTLLLAAALAATGAPVSAQTPSQPASPVTSPDFEKRHEALRKREDLQFEFTPPPKVEPIRREEPDALNWFDKLINSMGPFFQFVFWGGLIAGGLALLWFVSREALATRQSAQLKTKDAQVTDFRPAESRARALLAEADELAAAGKFDEAVRQLLHRSIGDIEKRAPNSIRKAQTSREIGGMPILPEAVRDAFAPITRAVEESWFGGRPVDAARYQACRKAYADFALPEAWTLSRTGARA